MRAMSKRVWLVLGVAWASGWAFADVPGDQAAGEGSPVETFEIGSTPGGRLLGGWRLGRPGADAMGRGPDERPALLIVAGLDGRHEFGSRVAVSLVDRLVTDHGDLLDSVTVYVVSNLNPDNDALFENGARPRADFGRAPEASDADRDGRIDEDPAEDLNGDGMITMMRVREPAPETGLTATHVVDPDEPRLMREADASKGERAEWALLVEGIDNDGDGRYNEDGFAGSGGGGIDLDRNFPSHWPEHSDGAGAHALSRPETRRLVEWMLTRDNIVAALAYTPGDNIINTPPTGKYGPDGREPTGIEEGDKLVYERVRELFKEATGQTGAPKRDWGGSFTQFAYAHFGVWSFSTPAWVRPDLVERGGEAEAPKADAEAGGENGGDGAGGFDPEAERRALEAQGVPAFVVDFILSSPEDRSGFMESFQSLPEGERAARIEAVGALPETIQLRVRALISGQPDPGPFASGQRGGDPAAGRSAGEAGRARRPSGRNSASDDAKWLAYSDEALGGAGFVDWTPFDHPQLGGVEIGGFVPGLRHEPPESEWSRVIDEQAAFVAGLLGEMPDLRVEVSGVRRVVPGVWRVRVRGTNPGSLPTRSAIGAKARRLAPIVVRPGVDEDRIVTGSPVVRWESIEGDGGFAEAEWVFRAADGSSVGVEVRSSVFGDRRLTVLLEEAE
jgi:hypothetical protein